MKNPIYGPSNFRARSGETVSVQPLALEEVGVFAPAILSVMEAAYRTFEHGPHPLLQPFSAAQHFRPSDVDRQVAQASRMSTYIRQGSTYRIARLAGVQTGSSPDSLTGLIKTTPSRTTLQKLARFLPNMDRPNCYINDIATRVQGNGIGSMLVLAALMDYDNASVVVADVIERAQPFFENTGFRPVRSLEQPLFIAGARLPLVRYEGIVGDVMMAAGSRVTGVN